MLAALKDTGRIRAELLRGSERGVVGEGIKNLEWTSPYSLGNQNKETKRPNTVKHVSYILFIHKGEKKKKAQITKTSHSLKLKNTTAEPLQFPLPCNQRTKKSKSEFGGFLHGTVI